VIFPDRVGTLHWELLDIGVRRSEPSNQNPVIRIKLRKEILRCVHKRDDDYSPKADYRGLIAEDACVFHSAASKSNSDISMKYIGEFGTIINLFFRR
jgi:hypothetical protein